MENGIQTCTTHCSTVGDEPELPDTPFLTTKESIGISTPLPLPTESVKPFALMALPVEVRNKVLSHLLPDVREIKLPEGWDWDEDWKPVVYRRDDACYTAILRVDRQLYAEGTAILYNRAFRVMVTHEGLHFLRKRYSLADIYEPVLGYYLEPNQMFTFPFHRVKQIQIELWATDFQHNLFDLRSALIDFCFILYDQPGLKNLRVDFYDRTYRPDICWSWWTNDDILYDDDEPHPAQDKPDGDMLIFHRDEIYSCDELGDIKSNLSELWERGDGTPASFHDIPSKITDLELILQPLQLLRGVGKARINLTAGAEKDHNLRRIARECQDAMMSSGPWDELDLKFMNWCTDPSVPWEAETLVSD